MAESVHIRLADEQSAASLVEDLLARFQPQLTRLDGHWEVSLANISEENVRTLLGMLEAWLDPRGETVEVALDGKAYRMEPRRRPG